MRVWLEQIIESLGFVTLPETEATCSWETIRWGSESEGSGFRNECYFINRQLREEFVSLRVNRASWNCDQSQCLLSAGGYCKKSEVHRKSLIMTQSLSDINEDWVIGMQSGGNKGKIRQYKNTQTDIVWPVEAEESEMSLAGIWNMFSWDMQHMWVVKHAREH